MLVLHALLLNPNQAQKPATESFFLGNFYIKKSFAQTNLAEKTLTWTLQIHHLAVIFCHYFILIYDTVQGRSGSIIIRLFGNTIFTFASRSRR